MLAFWLANKQTWEPLTSSDINTHPIVLVIVAVMNGSEEKLTMNLNQI